MSEHTPIEWADSSVNPVMGCDGCELWQPERGILHCYAGQLHKIRAGRPGYAEMFEIPKEFAGRMAKAAAWKDLRGTSRPDKPWLDGLPRHIFISDMGDALSLSISFSFLKTEVIDVVSSAAGQRHVWMWLTKNPGRMAQFAEWLAEQGIAWPKNLYAGTSVTSGAQLARVRQLRRVPAAVRFISQEPQLGEVIYGVDPDATTERFGVLTCLGCRGWGVRSRPGAPDVSGNPAEEECESCSGTGSAYSWIILGGESGGKAREYRLEWPRRTIAELAPLKLAVFFKQAGACPTIEYGSAERLREEEAYGYSMRALRPDGAPHSFRTGQPPPGSRAILKYNDRKGGDFALLPSDLRIRQMPGGPIVTA